MLIVDFLGTFNANGAAKATRSCTDTTTATSGSCTVTAYTLTTSDYDSTTYEFKGWDKNSDGSSDAAAGETITLTGNVTYEAILEIKDQSCPAITFSTNGNTTWAKSHSTTITATDATGVSTLKYLWSTSSSASASSGTTFTSGSTITKSTNTGNYYLCVYASDTLGNSCDKVCSNAFNFDNTVPVITPISSSVCLAKYSIMNVNTFINVTDAHSGVASGYPSAKVGSTSITNLSSYNTGTQTVTYTAKDNATNSTTKDVTFNIYSKIIGDQTILTSGSTDSGLYVDEYESGRYVYRGADPTNNYVSYGGKIWRIISIEADGTIKLINLESTLTAKYDIKSERYKSNSYCNQSSLGCNAWGTVAPDGNSYTNTIIAKSNANTIINGDSFYGTLTDTSAIDTSATFNVGVLNTTRSNTIANVLDEENNVQDTGPAGLLTASEFMRASTASDCLTMGNALDGNCNSDNWLASSTMTSGYGYWLIAGRASNRYYNFYINSEGLKSAENTLNYLKTLYPVIYLKNDTTFTGSGTSSDPYIVNSNCKVETTNAISSTTCSISSSDATTYTTEKTLTISHVPSSTTGISYSWDFINFGTATSNKQKTVNAAGVYSGFIKDSEGATNSCSITLVGRTEYQSTTCPEANISFSDWSLHSSSYTMSCSWYSKSEAEAAGSTWYRTCDETANSYCEILFPESQGICIVQQEYSRAGYCSSFEGGTVSEWTSSEITENFKTQVATRQTFIVG